MDSIEIMFKEYQTLRDEILTSMNNRVSILSFGMASVGAILTVSIAVFTSHSVLASLMLMLAVPAIISFILFMWLGEYQRMQRAGKFLVGIEDRINKMASDTLLTWETNLRSMRVHMKSPYDTTVMLLMLISLISVSLGLATLPSFSGSKWIIGIVGLVFHVILYQYAVHKIAKLRL